MKKLLILLSVFIFIGCASAKIIQTDKELPPYTGTVKVFFEKPTVPYERIGVISGHGEDVSWATVIKVVQEKAASIGANAIILIRPEKSTTGIGVYDPTLFGFFVTSSKKDLFAIAIRIE